MRRFALLLSLAVLSTGVPILPAPAAAQDLLIYRCVDAQGRVALRDSPCAKGETQQTRNMQRPAEPATPTPAVAPAAAAAAPASAPPQRVVYVSPPRPMYECVTAEGERYTSDSNEGNLRWVPYWTTAGYYPGWPRGGGGIHVSGQFDVGKGQVSFDSGRPTPLPPTPRPPPHPATGYVVPAGGAWVRDTCHALPQAEICSRLSDRRYEILRRYGNAMPSERRTLDLEQREIDARMANDCSG